MKFFHKTSALSIYKISSGFQSFKTRIREILSATSHATLEDFLDDDSLYAYYRNGESAEFVAASISGPCSESEDED
ncbi:MAG: hypothetical protein MJY99_12615 [Fibrobacter sp.]|uniref:hypothetical protein n=1 Tax=Fibrobacter sp. TaxID=35828 RepID=UPI00388F564B|nr:hypothetical protein [Fibrobacter sp.]